MNMSRLRVTCSAVAIAKPAQDAINTVRGTATTTTSNEFSA